MEETWDRHTSAEPFIGSGVVTRACYGPQRTLLHLQTFAGEHIEYLLNAVPDEQGASAFRANAQRPISVKIQAAGRQCSVIALGLDGPRRSTVTLGAALALYESGIHVVVEGGLRCEAPCSTTHRIASQA